MGSFEGHALQRQSVPHLFRLEHRFRPGRDRRAGGLGKCQSRQRKWRKPAAAALGSGARFPAAHICCHAPSGRTGRRWTNPHLYGWSAQSLLRRIPPGIGIFVPAIRSGKAAGQVVRRRSFAAVHAQLHHPPAGLCLARLALYQSNPLSFQFPVQLRGAIYGLQSMAGAASLLHRQDHPCGHIGLCMADFRQSQYIRCTLLGV